MYSFCLGEKKNPEIKWPICNIKNSSVIIHRNKCILSSLSVKLSSQTTVEPSPDGPKCNLVRRSSQRSLTWVLMNVTIGFLRMTVPYFCYVPFLITCHFKIQFAVNRVTSLRAGIGFSHPCVTNSLS